MKSPKLIIIFTALLALSLFWVTGCDDSKKDDDPTYTAQDIAGTWGAESMRVKLKIKSSTNQNGVNPLEEGNGGVLITGAVNGTLKHSLTLGLLGQYIVMATNLPFLDALNIDDILSKPSADTISFTLNVEGTPTEAYLSAMDAGMEKELENEDGTGFGFNASSYALSANQAAMASYDGTMNAMLNGTLTPESINLDKDKFKTVMDMPVPMTGDEAVLVFNADGTFTGNVFWEDIDEQGEGQWSIDGNDLTVSMEDLELEGLGELGGELEAQVEMDGEDMVVTLEMELLEVLEDLIDDLELEGMDFDMVKAMIESLFGMNMGTMSEMAIEAQFVLTPQTAISKATQLKSDIIGRHMLAPARDLLLLTNRARKALK